MTHRFLLVSVLCGSGVIGCFQEIDSTASKKYPTPEVLAAGPPIIVKTPDIETPDGGTAANPCEATTIAATAILTNDCAACHYGPGSPSGADWDILNFEQIKTSRQNAATPTDPTNPAQPMRLLVPGVPENGRIYIRAGIDMPKPGTVQNPTTKPTVSDRSVLFEWIKNCMGPSEAPGANGTGGATGTGGARGTGGATGTGGAGRGTGGASAAGGTTGSGGATAAGGRNGRGGAGGG